MPILTYADLAERWGMEENTLRQWRFRGKLPEPDLVVGNSPAWYEKTIAELEAQDGQTGKGRG